jgi:uncharacterized membrane protein YgaE (UPF0421/DUF939 family)
MKGWKGYVFTFVAGAVVALVVAFVTVRPDTLLNSIQSGLDHAADLDRSLAATRADVERWKALDAKDAANSAAALAEARRSNNHLQSQEQTISALVDSLSKRDSLLQTSESIRLQQSSYISSLEGSLATSQASIDQISEDLTSAQRAAQVVEAENKLLKIGGSVLLVGAAVLGGYEGGHVLKWW